MNIVDNSIYWLQKMEIDSIEKKQAYKKKIFINLIESEVYVYLIIADNGTGFLIPTDDVTEPFVSAKPGGMGLGLHIVREIMESQEGKLLLPEVGDFEVTEEFNNGATIVFALKK